MAEPSNENQQKPSIVYFTTSINSKGVLKVYDPIKAKIHGKVGIKVHFGEEGNKYYIRPDLVKGLQKITKGTFVETNVIYPGPRQNTESHIKLAKAHGFGYAPIDILDSEGETPRLVTLNHFNEIWVGSHQTRYDSFIIFSHFKGHAMSGFGGAIKNVSMGLASRAGKIALHSTHYPFTVPEKCINCGLCIKNCANNAISLNPVRVNPAKCIGCGKCIAVCPQKVYSVPWKRGDKAVFMEKLVDYAKAISANSPMVYINVLSNISPNCDCDAHAKAPFVHNIGILSSTDPVALDAACLDLVNKAKNSKDAFLDENSVSGNQQLDYGTQTGLGNRKYILLNVDKKKK